MMNNIDRISALALVLTIIAVIAACAGEIKPARDKNQAFKEAASAEGQKNEAKTLRLGYFPNITHSQALIGVANGDFQKALGSKVKLEASVFNAGPSVIEAIFANQLDIAYVGPNPAINGYIRSHGKALRIVAGATSGGASFVVRKGAGIRSAKDVDGKKLASPQLGNTQDVALRKFLRKNGFEVAEKGGTVQVVPVQNPDILTLFKRKELHGAWVPEPWAARLVKEGNGRIFIDERELWPDGKFVTANIIVRADFLKQNPDIVKKILEAHVNVTGWINRNPEDAKEAVNKEIENLTKEALPEDVLDEGFDRFEVTYDPVSDSLYKAAKSAFELGLLGRQKPELEGIHDLSLLNEVLSQKGLPKVK